MELIIWDFENNNEFYLENVKDNEIEYWLKCYKRERKKRMIKSKRKDKVHKCVDKIFYSSVLMSVLIMKQDTVEAFIDHIMLDNYNLFKGDKIIASEEEVEDICQTLEQQLGVTIDEEYKDEYLLLDAINRNNNLTDSQKDLCYRYIDLIIDNPYLDKQSVYKSLLNLEINYFDSANQEDERIKATYTYYTCDADVYGDEESTKIYLIHELVHCIYYNDKNEDLPRFILEGTAQLMTNEYFLKYPFIETGIYPFEVTAVKMLCDAASPDAVLKSLSTGNMYYIIEEMGKYIGSEKEAREAIEVLSTILDEHRYDEEISYTNDEIYEKCISKFRICNNYKLENDPNYDAGVAYYINEALLSNVYNGGLYDGYIETLESNGINRKAYFCSKLKEKLINEPTDYNYIDIKKSSDEILNGNYISNSEIKRERVKTLTKIVGG